MKTTGRVLALAGLVVALGFTGAVTVKAQEQTLNNVSYNPTRELYRAYGAYFSTFDAAARA